ncbi:transposase, partial [Pseudomonas syringae pv. actinidiae]|nr:transposase [Pseudomonas syringae pv. actinidiae]
MLYRIRVGCPWRDLLKEFGNWSKIYKRFNSWSASGKWFKVHEVLMTDPDLVYRLKINFSHACVVIAARARCILFKISSPLA